MKIVTKLLLCMLLVGSIVSQSTACSGATNPFLQWLAKGDSTVLLSTLSTATPFTFCNEVWSTASNVGTCCDPIKLQTQFEAKMKASSDRWNAYFKSLYRLRKMLDKINKIIGSDTPTQLTTMRSDITNYDLDGLTNDQIVSILAITTTFEARLTAFKTDAKTCFTASVTARGKAFCYGCWVGASNSAYFTTSGTNAPSFKMKSSTCNSIVGSCGPAWKFMYDTQTTMNLVAQISKKRMGGAGDATPANDKKVFNKASLKLSDVKTAFDNCGSTTYTVSANCAQANLDNLCSGFFSWAGTERIAREVKAENNQNKFNGRLLQDANIDDSTSNPDPNGADLSAVVTGPSTTASVDASNAGNDPSSTGSLSRLIGMSMTLLAACLMMIA